MDMTECSSVFSMNWLVSVNFSNVRFSGPRFVPIWSPFLLPTVPISLKIWPPLETHSMWEQCFDLRTHFFVSVFLTDSLLGVVPRGPRAERQPATRVRKIIDYHFFHHINMAYYRLFDTFIFSGYSTQLNFHLKKLAQSLM